MKPGLISGKSQPNLRIFRNLKKSHQNLKNSQEFSKNSQGFSGSLESRDFAEACPPDSRRGILVPTAVQTRMRGSWRDGDVNHQMRPRDCPWQGQGQTTPPLAASESMCAAVMRCRWIAGSGCANGTKPTRAANWTESAFTWDASTHHPHRCSLATWLQWEIAGAWPTRERPSQHNLCWALRWLASRQTDIGRRSTPLARRHLSARRVSDRVLNGKNALDLPRSQCLQPSSCAKTTDIALWNGNRARAGSNTPEQNHMRRIGAALISQGSLSSDRALTERSAPTALRDKRKLICAPSRAARAFRAPGWIHTQIKSQKCTSTPHQIIASGEGHRPRPKACFYLMMNLRNKSVSRHASLPFWSFALRDSFIYQGCLYSILWGSIFRWHRVGFFFVFRSGNYQRNYRDISSSSMYHIVFKQCSFWFPHFKILNDFRSSAMIPCVYFQCMCFPWIFILNPGKIDYKIWFQICSWHLKIDYVNQLSSPMSVEKKCLSKKNLLICNKMRRQMIAFSVSDIDHGGSRYNYVVVPALQHAWDFSCSAIIFLDPYYLHPIWIMIIDPC